MRYDLLSSDRLEAGTPRSIQLYRVDPATAQAPVHIRVGQDRAGHIDLKFGCPVPKVTRKGGGAALPWKTGLFREIVTRAVRAGGEIPVTVKMRKGIDEDHLKFLEAGRIAAAASVAAVALHARTDRKSTRLKPRHYCATRMPACA